MTQILPEDYLSGFPCTIVSISTALGKLTIPEDISFRNDGYLTLCKMNKFIRTYLPVRKRVDHRRGQRPKLKDMIFDGKAIVCVYGHCIYVDGENYYSFFDNSEDEIVAIWYLKD